MVKDKGNDQSSDAFHRINYLYQASQLQLEVADDKVLGAYYGLLAKEVAKKVVGKVHPDLKRLSCRACCIPLRDDLGTAESRILSHSKKSRKKTRIRKLGSKIVTLVRQCSLNDKVTEGRRKKDLRRQDDSESKTKLRRNNRPNQLASSCLNCGYYRSNRLKPDHTLWINAPESRNN